MSAKEQTDTPTPRTDAAIDEIFRCADGAMDLQRFTRQLEAELTALQADLRRLVEKWERELNARNNVAWSKEDNLAGEMLGRCFRELQEVANNPSLKPE